MTCREISYLPLHYVNSFLSFYYHTFCANCRYSNNFNVSIEMDPYSCNSTSEDLHICSEFSSFTDDCHFLNVISCDLEEISSIVTLTGN